MILCVTSVPAVPTAPAVPQATPTPAAAAANAKLGPATAPLVIELTDGWYRVSAEVDDVLAQAIQRGKLRVGIKLGIYGARVRQSGSAFCFES
jgi:breast cancer 2 susceptibility protein